MFIWSKRVQNAAGVIYLWANVSYDTFDIRVTRTPGTITGKVLIITCHLKCNVWIFLHAQLSRFYGTCLSPSGQTLVPTNHIEILYLLDKLNHFCVLWKSAKNTFFKLTRSRKYLMKHLYWYKRRKVYIDRIKRCS